MENVNTADVAEPIVAPSGGGVTSFDDLERIESLPQVKQQTVKTILKKNAQPDQKQKSENEEEIEEDADSESADQKKDQNKNKQNPKQAGQKQDKSKVAVQRTPIKIVSGDDTYELSPQAKVSVTVDGQTKEVSLHELRDDYAGKQSWGPRFQALVKERESIQNERRGLQESVNKLYQLAVVDKKPRQAIESLVDVMGGNPVEFWRELRKGFFDEFKMRRDLSDEDISLMDQKEELEYLRQQARSSKQNLDQQAAVRKVEAETRQIQSKYNIDDQSFWSAAEELVDSKTVDPNSVTPQMVADFYLEKKDSTQIESMLAEISEDLKVHTKTVYQTMKANGMTIDQMKEVISEVYGTPKPKGLAKKLGKQKQEARMPQNQDVWSFDQL